MARRKEYVPLRRQPAHRVAIVEQCEQTSVVAGVPVQVQLEYCRCGAWRARVLRGTRQLWTDWSFACPSPPEPPARDDAAQKP